MTVTLVEEYNPEWLAWFEQLRARLESCLNGIPHTIEHVGSTSIPGMTAKPIIDITIVAETDGFPTVKERLISIGYFHEGDKGLPGREAFGIEDSILKSSLPEHHLYVCEKGAKELTKHLAYREFMIKHPEWRAKLSEHKRELCERYNNDRQLYIDGKDAMMQEINRLALKEYQQPM